MEEERMKSFHPSQTKNTPLVSQNHLKVRTFDTSLR